MKKKRFSPEQIAGILREFEQCKSVKKIGDPKKQEENINALCFQLGIDRSIGTNL